MEEEYILISDSENYNYNDIYKNNHLYNSPDNFENVVSSGIQNDFEENSQIFNNINEKIETKLINPYESFQVSETDKINYFNKFENKSKITK